MKCQRNIATSTGEYIANLKTLRQKQNKESVSPINNTNQQKE